MNNKKGNVELKKFGLRAGMLLLVGTIGFGSGKYFYNSREDERTIQLSSEEIDNMVNSIEAFNKYFEETKEQDGFGEVDERNEMERLLDELESTRDKINENINNDDSFKPFSDLEDLYEENWENEGDPEAVIPTNDESEETKEKEKFTKWASLDDFYEFRKSLKDGHIETREHKYDTTAQYNPINDTDNYVCKTCGHVFTIKHIHNEDEHTNDNTNTNENNNTNNNTNNNSSNNHNNTDNTNNNNNTKRGWTKWEYFDENYERRYRIENRSRYEQRGHSYTDWSYDSQTGKDVSRCTTCGHIRTRDHQEEHTHPWGEWEYYDDNHERRYCKDDHSHYEERGHSLGEYKYNASTGKDESTCSTCGHVFQKDHTHPWGEWVSYNDDVERRYCKDDHSHYEERSHTYGEYKFNSSTGLEEAKCKTCGHVKTRAHSHTFGPWYKVDGDNVYHYRKCVDGDKTEKETHSVPSYTYDKSTGKDVGTCTVCGAKVYKDHIHNHNVERHDSIYDPISNPVDYCHATWWTCSGGGHDCPYPANTPMDANGNPYTSTAQYVDSTHNFIIKYKDTGMDYYVTYTCTDCNYFMESYEQSIPEGAIPMTKSNYKNNLLDMKKYILSAFKKEDSKEDIDNKVLQKRV